MSAGDGDNKMLPFVGEGQQVKLIFPLNNLSSEKRCKCCISRSARELVCACLLCLGLPEVLVYRCIVLVGIRVR